MGKRFECGTVVSFAVRMLFSLLLVDHFNLNSWMMSVYFHLNESLLVWILCGPMRKWPDEQIHWSLRVCWKSRVFFPCRWILAHLNACRLASFFHIFRAAGAWGFFFQFYCYFLILHRDRDNTRLSDYFSCSSHSLSLIFLLHCFGIQARIDTHLGCRVYGSTISNHMKHKLFNYT